MLFLECSLVALNRYSQFGFVFNSMHVLNIDPFLPFIFIFLKQQFIASICQTVFLILKSLHLCFALLFLPLCGYRQTEEEPEKEVSCDQPSMEKHLINMYKQLYLKQKDYRNVINHGTYDITKRKKRPHGLLQNFTDFLPSSRKPTQPPF